MFMYFMQVKIFTKLIEGPFVLEDEFIISLETEDLTPGDFIFACESLLGILDRISNGKAYYIPAAKFLYA